MTDPPTLTKRTYELLERLRKAHPSSALLFDADATIGHQLVKLGLLEFTGADSSRGRWFRATNLALRESRGGGDETA